LVHSFRPRSLPMGKLPNLEVSGRRPATAMDERNVRHSFKELLHAAELPDMRLHDLRHTTATLLLSQGVHARVVMEALGHSQVSLTLDTYSPPSACKRRLAVRLAVRRRKRPPTTCKKLEIL
jgi:site-specific recombinase XerD